ncbi:PREDICTED: protein ECT2 isoform X2 [Nicrophorus vespilloides]|uniref:Protein ECT2 isoform X2 n=1 Tax=Nicrophorus vespilloides TaxID=110193 RepID=A0ABM1M282_NICVS|nr:PREDICTED: protein ECT2 isoform X2 [Nicrophorus vespilloides]
MFESIVLLCLSDDESMVCDTEALGSASALPLDKRICLVGGAANDEAVCGAAQSFGVPIVTSPDGYEYAGDQSCSTIFVLEKFQGPQYDHLCKSRHPLLGMPALRQLAIRKDKLPNNTRPLYTLAMTGVVVCFTGFRNKEDLTRLVPLVHHMGGSIRKEMSFKVTHLIANASGGEKYKYANVFRLPIMNYAWVLTSWDRRNDMEFSAICDKFVSEFKLKPFHGARVCFLGFPEEEEKHMAEILVSNGGTVAPLDDPTCTHVVMDHAENYPLEANGGSHTPQPVITLESNEPSPTLTIASELTTPPNEQQLQQLALRKAEFKTPKLSTLHEKSHDDAICSQLNDTVFDTTVNMQNLDLDQSTSSTRKRKLRSPESSFLCSKRNKKDLSYSENTKRKITDFLRTPFNYLSNRRRTIGANRSLNEGEIMVDSTSGIFEVQTFDNLSSSCNRTPANNNGKKPRKNLFQRTFSSSKFVRNTTRKNDLNATKLSFTECDGGNSMNISCFPDFSEQSNLHSTFLEPRQLRSTGPDPSGAHLTHAAVVDESQVTERPDVVPKAHVVKAEWFWTSVQKEISLEEKAYLLMELNDRVSSPSVRRDSHQATPGSASRRKRKRLLETLAHPQQSPVVHHKRRSSISDAGLHSVSGSFLDCTASPDKALYDGTESSTVPDTPRKGLTARQQVFLELVQTESNYVNILDTIMKMFKKHLEEMDEEDALLNNTELKIIFGNVPLIFETHLKMLDELRKLSAHWSEEKCVGNVILKYSTDLLKAYPPFVNFFEEMKEMLTQCDVNKPRFHAFLKACQTRPECGRQGLQDLLIRPVQRLPSISLLLNDILKNTPKSNPDHNALDQALASIREVMTHINEDKRKTEGQRVMFDIFNDIDNCPPDLVSSHRSFIAKSEVVQLSSSEGLSGKGNPLVLFLFSDQLEICKKRSKAFNTMKSPNTVNGLHKNSASKPYKHIKLMSLSNIKRVIDIKETEDCQKVFGFVVRHNDELKERLFTFVMSDEDADKVTFLKTLCRQMATNACTADSDKFMAFLEPHDLDINTSDVNNGTLSKAFKFATRTRLKVGRAFSFNKTPSKLKRAVSSMISSPFGSSTNLTPASQLAQMRLASYNNISELGNADNVDSPPIAPLSVQPTRKLKTGSLGVSALKRL